MRLNKGEKGFGLVEVMVGAGLLTIAIVGTLFAFQDRLTARSRSTKNASLHNIRVSVMNTIHGDSAWREIVERNNSFQCVKDGTDCRNAGGSFALYGSDGALIYDPQAAGAGFSSQVSDLGISACSTFNPLAGDSNCPFHLNLSWAPICLNDGNPCINPPVRVTGTWTLAPGPNATMITNTNRLNFDFTRSKPYCEPQANESYAIAAGSVAVGVTPRQVVATIGGKVANPGVAILNTDLQPCEEFRVQFQNTMGYSNGAVATDDENQASICFYLATENPLTATCIFEWRQVKEEWQLHARGVEVLTANPGEALNSSTIFEFVFRHGLVTAHVNNSRRFVFDEVLAQPIRVAFRPATTDYSPNGIRPINVSFR